MPTVNGGKRDYFGNPILGGPMLGRALLWKLQVGVHRDVKDYLCIIFNSGKYTGGAALFPDLGMKFKYVMVPPHTSIRH